MTKTLLEGFKESGLDAFQKRSRLAPDSQVGIYFAGDPAPDLVRRFFFSGIRSACSMGSKRQICVLTATTCRLSRCQPFGIATIRLESRQPLHVSRVQQHQIGDVAFQHIPHRSPGLARRFRGHFGDLAALQPGCAAPDRAGKCGTSPASTCPAFRRQDANTEILLVDIDSTTTAIYWFYVAPFRRRAKGRWEKTRQSYSCSPPVAETTIHTS